jgi:hypothetical protein
MTFEGKTDLTIDYLEESDYQYIRQWLNEQGVKNHAYS